LATRPPEDGLGQHQQKEIDVKQFSKVAQKHIESLAGDLRASASSLQEQHSDLLEAVREFNALVTKHNEKVQETTTFLEELKGDMEGYFEERSEKWQEGDAGQDYQAWIDAVGEAIDGLEQVEEVDEPEEPVVDGLDALDELPTSP
jgi:hypothetical protein